MSKARDFLNEWARNPDASVEFDGKNAEEVESFLRKHGFNLKKEAKGRISVTVDGKETTIFKDDVVTIENKKLHIIKPSYVTG
jgi:hypothetical protein